MSCSQDEEVRALRRHEAVAGSSGRAVRDEGNFGLQAFAGGEWATCLNTNNFCERRFDVGVRMAWKNRDV